VADTPITTRRANSADRAAISALLTEARLPIAGLDAHIADFVVAEQDGAVVGCAGLERYGTTALLRSVAVAPALRGTGLGPRLTAACIDAARARGLSSLALLTETAERFFPRFGFTVVPRTALPSELRESEELKGACPDTAVSMMLELV
jgi:amino-acid N-acetyltransferase